MGKTYAALWKNSMKQKSLTRLRIDYRQKHGLLALFQIAAPGAGLKGVSGLSRRFKSHSYKDR